MRLPAIFAAALLAAAPAAGEEAKKTASVEEICTLIGAAAEAHGLPRNFFARLIWKESRFDVRALSPVGAQGVAQFMPYTAKERGLADPYDPAQAIPASAWFLADLKAQFGNFGLAAAGYNAGPNRVSAWLAGRSGLPAETRDYVWSITGKSAEWFRDRERNVANRPIEGELSFEKGCPRLPVIKTRSSPVPRYGVAVAGGRTSGAASQAAGRAARKARGKYELASVEIVRNRKRGSGPRWYAVVPSGSLLGARKLCLRIRSAGAPCNIWKR